MIDVNKPIRTEKGQKARILATDLKGRYHIAVAYRDPTDVMDIVAKFDMDLLEETFENIPERKSRWLNIYDFDKFLVQTLYVTKDAAKLGISSCTSCQGVLELVYENDKFIEVIFHKD